MKRIVIICVFVLLSGCDSENAWDCIQTAGPIVQYDVEVPVFSRVLVNRDVELILADGPDYMVRVETGENLTNDVEVKVVGDQLLLTDNNSCNYVREYGITKIFVTAPDLSEIRNSSQYEVSSATVLNFEDLTLVSEDFNVPGSFNVGDFRLNINADRLLITNNDRSSYFISGEVENLIIGFYAGNGRFEAQNLIAQHIDVFHRGSNDIIVNPQQSVSGELRSTGNLILLNEPPLVDVQAYYTGQLIIQN
ncbi:MAG: DUF2807 domain-containing protein [Flavobacteriaceae bacterium]|nr:DUF2807 domain-containing protein [Bacteroidia bacterium]MBT8287819.1 DUF2807 domain-containing protein [Bacteroidia bacterium]NNF76162.1 DUF2807 domain-containing protein [Flavobacteriaceae bacterium]NNK73890.1 DUF2807 domain-containing protein [Flavobacteriaceae bacterium]